MGRPFGTKLTRPQDGSKVPMIRALALEGLSRTAIATRLGITYPFVYRSIKRWRSTPWWKHGSMNGPHCHAKPKAAAEPATTLGNFQRRYAGIRAVTATRAAPAERAYTVDDVKRITLDVVQRLIITGKLAEVKAANNGKAPAPIVPPMQLRKDTHPRAGSKVPAMRALMRAGYTLRDAGEAVGYDRTHAEKAYNRWSETPWWKSGAKARAQ
jgi:hypothetical protein